MWFDDSKLNGAENFPLFYDALKVNNIFLMFHLLARFTEDLAWQLIGFVFKAILFLFLIKKRLICLKCKIF